MHDPINSIIFDSEPYTVHTNIPSAYSTRFYMDGMDPLSSTTMRLLAPTIRISVIRKALILFMHAFKSYFQLMPMCLFFYLEITKISWS